MGVIVKSIFCIGVLTAISPLNDTRVEMATLSQTKATLTAAPALIGQAAQHCTQNPALCRDSASSLFAPANAAAQAIASKPRGG